jgi:hypothetical protein
MIFRYWNRKYVPEEYPNMDLLGFGKEGDKNQELKRLRMEYIMKADIPKWKRKEFLRKSLIKVLVPAFICVFVYRKAERIIDFFEYGF